MSVERVWEAPRVTKPYTEEQWSEIERLGHAIDADLTADDVRLTMGGEPTFVALDDPDGAEWNTAALGPNKRRLAAQLYQRLREKYAPQGLVHFGQGKWYPGEPLPRWSLNCFWRRDGEPIWHDNSAHRGRADRLRPRRMRPRSASLWKSPRNSDCTRHSCSPRTKTTSTTCGASAACRRTWIRSIRGSRTQGARSGWRACSSRGLDAGRRPCAAAGARCRRVRAGKADAGSCAVSAATCCRAIRRSAFACRSIRCRG